MHTADASALTPHRHPRTGTLTSSQVFENRFATIRPGSPKSAKDQGYGPSKFGRYPGDPPSFSGRRVDLLGRSLEVLPGADPATVLRDYLSVALTASAKALAAKAVVLMYPEQLAGKVVWQPNPFR